MGIVSGIKLIGFHRIDRRTHYVVAASLALGVGTALVPNFSKPGIGVSAAEPHQWWPYEEGMSDATDSLRVGLMIAMDTPYFIGSLAAIILNLIIPMETVDDIDLETIWKDEESTNAAPEEFEEDKQKEVEA